MGLPVECGSHPDSDKTAPQLYALKQASRYGNYLSSPLQKYPLGSKCATDDRVIRFIRQNQLLNELFRRAILNSSLITPDVSSRYRDILQKR